MAGMAGRHLAEPLDLVGFLAYQAFIGSAFGLGFVVLNARIAPALRG
jgi:hypothetical protein